MAADGSLVLDRAEARARNRFTVDEYMAMMEAKVFGDLAHVELVDGELIEMPPEGSGHALNNSKAFLLLAPLARVAGLGVAANMAIRVGEARVVGPDLVVFDRPAGRPSTVEARLVWLALEHTLSTRSYDLNRKPGLYAEGGVRELWVLDGVKLVLHRFHSPRDGVYQRDPPRGLDEEVDVPFAPGERVRIGDLFDLD
jgi:Uma2 family endonuclease